MASGFSSAKLLSKLMLTYSQLDPEEDISMKFYLRFKSFPSRKLKTSSAKWQLFCLSFNALMQMIQQHPSIVFTHHLEAAPLEALGTCSYADQ